jgi:probable HAF family extracellular repeat protein
MLKTPLFLLTLLLSTSLSQASVMYSVEALGFLGSTNPNSSAANGVNNAGEVTGYSNVYDSSGNFLGTRVFAYSNGQMVNLGTLGTTSGGYGQSNGTGINASGQVTGTSDAYDSLGNYTGTYAFRYSNGQITSLGSLGTDGNGFGSSFGFGINSNGDVTGFSNAYDGIGNFLGAYAFVSTNGQMTSLGSFGTDGSGIGSSVGAAINDAGDVAGRSIAYDADHNYVGTYAFVYSNNQLNNLGSLGTDNSGYGYSLATAINNAGFVAGESAVYDSSGNSLGDRAFTYGNGQMTNLGTLFVNSSGYGFSGANGLNDAGAVVGYSNQYDDYGNSIGQSAFLYQGGVMQDLNALIDPSSGWILESATSINSTGQIAGYGLYQGQIQAFLLNSTIGAAVTDTPEPASFMLLGAGLLAMYVATRHREKS